MIDVRAGRRVAGMDVVITGDRISALGPTGQLRVPGGASIVNAAGRYLIPGLIDTHVHLGEQWERQPADTLALLSWIVAGGVTTVRDMGSSPLEENLLALDAAGAAGSIVAPRIMVAAPPTRELIRRLGAEDRRSALRRFRAAGIAAVKVLGHPRDTALAIIADARAEGLPVMGHTLGSPGPDGRVVNFTMDAVREGMTGVSHVHAALYPLALEAADQPPVLPRTTPEGRRAWTLYQLTAWRRAGDTPVRALIDSMVARDVWFEPTLTLLRFRAEQYDSAALARYQTWQRQPPLGGDPAIVDAALAQHEAGDRFVRWFHEAGGMIVAGSDVMPLLPLGVSEELRLLARAGLPPAAALRAATVDAARALELDDRIGTIEVGRRADMVLLDADPIADIGNVRRIRAVVLGGRVLDRTMLDSLLRRTGTPTGASVPGR